MNLQNKVAWITGGARMGATVAEALSKRGCRIVLTYRKSREAAEETIEQLRLQGTEAIALRCDLTRRREIEEAARRIFQRFGSLDLLVNLSSIYEETPLRKTAKAEHGWQTHMQANALSAYLLTLSAAPWMNRGDGGRMVHIADWTSASGRPRYKSYTPYYVSKKAIQGIVEAMALEMAPKILVNAIAPGPILPPPGLSAREIKAVMKATPLGRWGGAAEIAKAVLFLMETDFVTGETIRVDGGRHLS